MQLQPTADYIYLRRITKNNVTDGGIELPDSRNEPDPEVAVVVAKGPDAPAYLEEGHVVRFDEGASAPVRWGKFEDVVIVPATGILGVSTQEGASADGVKIRFIGDS